MIMHVVLFFFLTGYIHTCKELGEGAPATSQPEYCYCTGRKQSRSGQQEGCRFPGKDTLLQSDADVYNEILE